MHKIIPAITAIILLIVAIIGYILWQKNANLPLEETITVATPIESPQAPSVVHTAPVLPIATLPESEDQIDQESNHREPDVTPNEVAPETASKPLLTLEESDDAIKAVAEQFASLIPFFVWENFIPHLVVTIDNIPNKKLPRRYSFAKPVVGKFSVAIEKDTEAIMLDDINYQRYENLLNILDAIELEKLISHYQYFYPLLQQSYEQLGYPDKQFHDRLLAVIQHLQNTPEIQKPIYLIRPKVFYQFKDPELESLSAGQKIMLRIGTKNRQKVKAKLKELRIILANLSL